MSEEQPYIPEYIFTEKEPLGFVFRKNLNNLIRFGIFFFLAGSFYGFLSVLSNWNRLCLFT